MSYFTWKLELVSDILLLIVELLSFHSVSIFWLLGTVSEKLPGGLYLTESHSFFSQKLRFRYLTGFWKRPFLKKNIFWIYWITTWLIHDAMLISVYLIQFFCFWYLVFVQSYHLRFLNFHVTSFYIYILLL